MRLFPLLGDHLSWFVVFPDSPGAFPLAERLGEYATQHVSHPSGRPWLVGRWNGGEVLTASAGPSSIAIVGHHDISRDRLERFAQYVRDSADVTGLLAGSHGSFHVHSSISGNARSQGSLLQMRRVLHGRTASGLSVAADRADVLAWLLDRDVSDRGLALQLIGPNIPFPLDRLTAWDGIEVVPGDHYLELRADGSSKQVRWWEPPEPSVPMSRGADAFRDVLASAVEVHARHADMVTSDLGGVDSTALCGLLSRFSTKVVACTVASLDAHDEDLTYAERTIRQLPNVGHEVIPADRFPLYYDNLDTAMPPIDEPFAAAVGLSRLNTILDWAYAQGSRHHFGGYGGDELLYGTHAWVKSYLVTDPVLAIRNVRGLRANNRWSWPATLRPLLDQKSYRAWLNQVADGLLRSPAKAAVATDLDWGTMAVPGPWTTPDALRLLWGTLKENAAHAEPLSRIHGLHADLSLMRSTSRLTNQISQIAGYRGMRLHAPFYDNQVIEAGLRVRPQDRITRWRYKPLLVEAMRGMAWHESITRETKAEGSAAAEYGMREHRRSLVDFFAESRLADLGMVDRKKLISECERPHVAPHELGHQLYPLLGCELWLRQIANAGSPRPVRPKETFRCSR